MLLLANNDPWWMQCCSMKGYRSRGPKIFGGHGEGRGHCKLWILTIWPYRRGGEGNMICLTEDFNKDMWQERGHVWNHKLNYSKHDWAIVWCDGLVIHSWGSTNCSFILFYSALLRPEGFGKRLTDSRTRQTNCPPFPLNLATIDLFSQLSLWCKCTDLLG